MLVPRAFRIAPLDNVATLLDDGEEGPLAILGEGSGNGQLRERIKLGHKVALQDLAEGAPIIKFGIPIGRASKPIGIGTWVHLHNCKSFFDERSQTLDLHTGGATDTAYE